MIDVKELKMEMETITKGGKPKRIQVIVNPESIRMPKYRNNNAPVVCPRSAEDVYSLGISLQNYIGSVYLELAEMNKGRKNPYSSLVLNQLIIKKEVEKLAKDNLNQLLAYFYENGGPIIEPPVSEQSASEIQPHINRITGTFVNQIDLIVNRSAEENMDAAAVDNEINDLIITMYTAMSKLFDSNAMQNAFDELISVRNL